MGTVDDSGTLTATGTYHGGAIGSLCETSKLKKTKYLPFPFTDPIPCVRGDCIPEECCEEDRSAAVLDTCQTVFGDEVCGINGCRCNPFDELRCVQPPNASESGVSVESPQSFDPNATVCVARPMCGPAEETLTSGFNQAVLWIAMQLCAIFFFMLMQCLLISYNFWSCVDNTIQEMKPKAATRQTRWKSRLYHRFTVAFDSWFRSNVVFCLGADVEPEVVADTVACTRFGSFDAYPADASEQY
jgi:hypothetical protein